MLNNSNSLFPAPLHLDYNLLGVVTGPAVTILNPNTLVRTPKHLVTSGVFDKHFISIPGRVATTDQETWPGEAILYLWREEKQKKWEARFFEIEPVLRAGLQNNDWFVLHIGEKNGQSIFIFDLQLWHRH